MEIISTRDISKYFGNTAAIDHISIHVNEGEVYGFLGLNGAGKTTLIRMLLGMIQPSNGEISLFGRKLTRDFNLWNNIGYLVETPYAYPNLSVLENLEVYYQYRQLRDRKLINNIIEQLKLGHFIHTKAQHLSLGNKQRLGLAKALIHRPKLLILDEPINGLDPEGIAEVRELLITLANEGSTILLSSHILSEITKVADRIGIIHQGKLIDELSIGELNKRLVKKVLVNTHNNKKALQYLIEARYEVILNANNELEVINECAITNPEYLATLLVEKEIPPTQLYLQTEDLEMFFLRTIRP
ncbi:ABC transporter ATP-binding protein [Emticicia fontis]